MSPESESVVQPKRKCFVITPIGSETDPIRRHVDGIIDAAIRPALEQKYDVFVAHRISTPGSITKQIIKEIYQDDLVIANLTNRNPNVMYELAFRHSLGKPVIIIAAKGTDLPFDVTSERTIFYQDDAKGVLELRESLEGVEQEINFGADVRSGMIYDIIREIDKDAEIVESLKKVESKDGDNSDALQYIIQKLNTIEAKISPMPKAASSRSSNHIIRRSDTISVEFDPKEGINYSNLDVDLIAGEINNKFKEKSIEATVADSAIRATSKPYCFLFLIRHSGIPERLLKESVYDVIQNKVENIIDISMI